MTRTDRVLLAFGAALVFLVGAGMSLGVGRTTGAAHLLRVNVLVASMMVSALVYFGAVRAVRRSPPGPRTLWIVLGVATLLRVLVLAAPPFLSSDIYRYVWDGRVQAHGINPYSHVPADPALAALRDDAVYPHINRRDYARTIYPPAAQLVFAANGVAGGGVPGMRLAMVGFEALGMLCLLALLPREGVPRTHLLIYAWNPLPLWSFASDGHVDAIAVGLLAAALLLRARGHASRAGAVLAAAALVKFLPLAVAPAFARRGPILAPALAGLAVVAAGYALYSSAGTHVLGFLPSYGREEGLANGGGIWLLAGLGEIISLPRAATPIYAATAAVCLAALAIRVMRDPAPENDVRTLARHTGALASLAMVAVSPHYPWYFAWLAVPACLAPARWLIWLATAPMLLFLDPIPHDRFLWPALVYAPALLMKLADGRDVRSPTPLAETGGIGCPLRSP